MTTPKNPNLLYLEDLLIQVQLSARNEAHSKTKIVDDESYQASSLQRAVFETKRILRAVELSCYMSMRTGVISEKSSKNLMKVFEDAANNARESQEILSPWDSENVFRKALCKNWKTGWRTVGEVWS